MVPRRWHLYIVDLGPARGTKPGKQRPCLAIQPDVFGESGLDSTVVLPLTTRPGPQDFPVRVVVPRGTCGLERESRVMVDQMLAWDHAFFRRELGVLPEALQGRVRDALREFLDL